MLKRFSPLWEDVFRGRFLYTNDSTTPERSSTGTAQSATTNTLTLAADASATNDYYQYWQVLITAGTGSGQDHLRVTSYDGTTKIATLSGDWITTPDSTSVYKLIDRDIDK